MADQSTNNNNNKARKGPDPFLSSMERVVEATQGGECVGRMERVEPGPNGAIRETTPSKYFGRQKK